MDLEELQILFAKLGVIQVYAKKLAPNDNSKNQPYMAPSLSILSSFPTGEIVPSGDGKRGPRFIARIDLHWINPSGDSAPAPGAKFILYPQYPEVRFSGFLRGCPTAPNSVMTSREEGRVLVFGVRSDGRMYGFADTRESAIGVAINRLSRAPDAGVFYKITNSDVDADTDSRTLLLAELQRIHRLGWIPSRRLTSTGESVPCNATNCGGYTLEAELGVSANGFSEPDFEGWEIKSRVVPRFGTAHNRPVTLMTPEPKIGVYAEQGVEHFVRKYGYRDRRGRDDRMNFGGTFRNRIRDKNTGLTLRVQGWNSESGAMIASDGAIELVDDYDNVAAGWAFADLIEHWGRKHARAAFVPCECLKNGVRQYRYADVVNLGVGSDFRLFLSAVASGTVYYDPGIKLENISRATVRTKRRSQFRMKASDLRQLYAEWEDVEVA